MLDASWLEFFADSDHADLYASAIEAVEHLVVPVITVCGVVKKLLREAGDEVASMAMSLMQRSRVVEIDLSLAPETATLGLPLACSLIYATAGTKLSSSRAVTPPAAPAPARRRESAW